MVSVHSQHLTFKSAAIDSLFMVVVIISKKNIKLATARNKIKRQLRALFKNSPIKGVVYTKKSIQNLTYKELQAEVQEVLGKLIKV